MGFIFVTLFALLAAFDRPIHRGRNASKANTTDATGSHGA